MHVYSVRKLVPLTVLDFRIITKSRIVVNMLNIIDGCLILAFRKFIKTLYEWFSRVQDPQGIISGRLEMGFLARLVRWNTWADKAMEQRVEIAKAYPEAWLKHPHYPM